MSQTDVLTAQLKKALIQLIAIRTGLKIRAHDQEMLQEVICKRTKQTKSSFPEDYYRLLKAETEDSRKEWKILISQLTNTESFFFRDAGQFTLLKDVLLPQLIQRKSETKTLRLCSAGCSTGEEPYSLAILLHILIPDLESWKLTISGIDINPLALKMARTGIYRAWSFRGVNRNIQKRFFEPKGDQYHIKESIKNMVEFQTINLLSDSFTASKHAIKDMDLILCRNVFIYFHQQAIQTVLDKFYEALCPQGYLLVGHTELHGQNPKKFLVNVYEESLAYQRPGDEISEVKQSNLHVSPIVAASPEVSKPQSDPNLLEAHDIKMQKASLDLLRQLPADTRIVRLGNRTASELILQIEQNLKAIE